MGSPRCCGFLHRGGVVLGASYPLSRFLCEPSGNPEGPHRNHPGALQKVDAPGRAHLTDYEERFLRECRLVIHDRATVFTKEFVSILGCAGVESIPLPARSPYLNAFAERFVRSITSECFDHLILAGSDHCCRCSTSTMKNGITKG